MSQSTRCNAECTLLHTDKQRWRVGFKTGNKYSKIRHPLNKYTLKRCANVPYGELKQKAYGQTEAVTKFFSLKSLMVGREIYSYTGTHVQMKVPQNHFDLKIDINVEK